MRPPSHPLSDGLLYWRESAGGEFLPARSVPLTDRGFRYGMAVFETLRIHGGRALFLQEHLDRLERACRTFSFPVAEPRLRAVGEFFAHKSVKDSVFTPQAHGVARIHVTAGDGSLSAPPGPSCRIFVSWEPREPVDEQIRRRGLRLRLHPHPHHPTMGGAKTHNYWANLEALAAARREGADEALLCDGQGRLISSCTGNVFMVTGDGLITPPLTSGARPGVIREWVLKNFGAREQEVVARGKNSGFGGTAFLLTNSWLGPARATLGEHTVLNTVTPLVDTVISSYNISALSLT